VTGRERSSPVTLKIVGSALLQNVGNALHGVNAEDAKQRGARNSGNVSNSFRVVW